MDLRQELARQSLLLEFIADCVGLGNVPDLAKLVMSRLHWICAFDACSVLQSGAGSTRMWSQDRLVDAMPPIADSSLAAEHRALLDGAMARQAPVLGDRATARHFLVAFPLGGHDTALGALCISRVTSQFTQGDLRHLQHACSALGGAMTRIAAIAAEHDAERAVREAELKLRSAAEDRALLAEQMIGIVSHDLRNPLSAILVGTAMMARGEPLPARKDRVLGNVQGAARRAQRLVEELLDFTQARVGNGLALKIDTVDLDLFMSTSVQELQLSFPSTEIVCHADRLGSARWDADRMQQLLGNLVANAVTYGTPGCPIQVNGRVTDGSFELSVRNEGPAVPESLQSNMFEPMVRGTNQNGQTRGVGLGLFIVRAIAEGHGGSVDVSSSANAGTVFTVRLPVADPGVRL